MNTEAALREVYERVAEDQEQVNTPVEAVPTPVLVPAPVKKLLTLDHLRKRNAEKPLIKVEVSGLSDNETLICWRRDNIPASVVEDFRKKGEDRDLLKTVLDVVSTFVLNEQGNPLGTREEWAQFDIDTLNTILSALFESSNKVGEA